MYLSSNAEGLMLRDIINRPYYDLAYLMDDSYSGGFSSVSTDMIYRVVTAGVKFRTVFKQSEKQFRRFLETYRKTFGYLEGTPGETTVAPTTTVAATTVPVAATTAAKPTTKPPVVTSPKPTAPKPTSKPTAAPATTKAPATTAKPKPTVPATTAAPAPGLTDATK